MIPPDKMMQIQVRGVNFKNVHEAAEHFGVSPSNIYAMLCKGREDYIGLGRGKSPSSRRGKNRCKEVTVGSRVFESYAELDRFLGMGRGYSNRAHQRKLRGDTGNWECLVRKLHEKQAEEDKRHQDAVWNRVPKDAHYI